jgi:hypothetical protein
MLAILTARAEHVLAPPAVRPRRNRRDGTNNSTSDQRTPQLTAKQIAECDPLPMQACSQLIAAGVMIAGLLRRTIGTGTGSSVVYWATIALFTAMGLNYMGIADSIVNLAFGAVVVGGALAAALAFGLGGREAAARLLNKTETKLEVEEADPML